MRQHILYLFTRTPLHLGAGASVGAVDQPVQRERHTGFPIVPGSSIKGVLADGEGFLEKDSGGKLVRSGRGHVLFGREASKEKDDSGSVGALSFSEAKLLAFPVRSAKGCFAWLTSPLSLKRWSRASGVDVGAIPTPNGQEAYFDPETLGQGDAALLEDYIFTHLGEFSLAPLLSKAISVDGIWRDLAAKHLVLVSDDSLAHFARNACEVAQHVVIDDETGTAKNGLLFNQENVPSDTLFYSSIIDLKGDAIGDLTIPNPIQLGGDATTGLGFCSTNLTAVDSNAN